MRTQRYRDQHNDLVKVVTDLERILEPRGLAANAGDARRLLSTLVGKLTLHLSAEDRVLYPELAKSSDARVRDLAQKYAREMGPLAAAFQAYVGRWPTNDLIQSNPAGFIAETRKIIHALKDRIRRENTEFYAAVDAA